MPTPQKLDITPRPGGIELAIKVVPGASRTRIAGVLGTSLKVAVSAPPEGGKANAAVCQLLAEVLGVRKGDVQIVSGHTQPHKRAAVAGLTVQQACQKLGLQPT